VSEPSLTDNDYDSDGELADLPPLRRARLSQPQAPPSPASAMQVNTARARFNVLPSSKARCARLA
jgi:hypothetical protein